MERGLIAFAFVVTGGLTLVLGQPASPQRYVGALSPVVISAANAELRLSSDTLRRGETLAAVLARQSLSAGERAQAVDALKAFASPRTLRPGVTVGVERTPWDSVTRLTVRVDNDNIVQIEPGPDGWTSQLTEVPVRIDTLVLNGSIRSSLYNSVMALN